MSRRKKIKKPVLPELHSLPQQYVLRGAVTISHCHLDDSVLRKACLIFTHPFTQTGVCQRLIRRKLVDQKIIFRR